MTHTRTHTHITFADPNLRCDVCGQPVEAFHDPVRCGCEGQHQNFPCGHIGATTACPSWGPVDGCRCEGHPHADHRTPPGMPTARPDEATP